jgi:beta-glucosidase
VCLTAKCEFTEGTLIDYRWFDSSNISVRYPFGHGLSYTEFTYGATTAIVTNSTAIKSRYPTGRMGLGGESDLWEEVISISLAIQNTGPVAGAEVAQLYLSFPAEAKQPVRILRGFQKPSIPAGASATVTFSLRRRDISYWDVVAQKWAIAAGEYTFSVGSSSRDIRATTTLTL